VRKKKRMKNTQETFFLEFTKSAFQRKELPNNAKARFGQ